MLLSFAKPYQTIRPQQKCACAPSISHTQFLRSPILPLDRGELKKNSITAVVLGFPFDSTTLARPGSSLGPRAIRDASTNFLSYHYGFNIDLAKRIRLADCGDLAMIPGYSYIPVEWCGEWDSNPRTATRQAPEAIAAL